MKLRPNILIVDDTEENLTLLEYMMCTINVNLIQALSGAEALEKTRGVELALAILDVQMPEMSGFELAVKLNENRTLDKVPILFLTASNTSEKELFKGYESGAVDYINKPVNSQILLSKIKVFIDLFNYKQTIINDNADLLNKSSEELISSNDALKKKQEKLEIEQLFTKSLLNCIPGIFYLYTYPELLMVAWNKRHETLFGFQPEEMEGRHVLEWHLPETRKAVLESLENVEDSGNVSIETPLMAKDGHLIPFLLTGIKFESNGQNYLIGIGTDVTERLKAEKLLKESEATLTIAQQIAHLGSWELEDSIDKFQWSDETYRIFGFTPQSVCPTMELFFQCIHPDDLSFVQMNLITAWDTRTSFSLDHRIILPNGGERNVHQQAEIMYDKAGNPQKWLGTVQDITERKKTEEEVKSSLEQLKQLSKYIEQVRENERIAISRELHDDLGQALTAVKIDLGIIKRTVGDNEAVTKIIKVTNLVSETIKTVQRLTSQLRPEIIDDLGLEAAIEWYTKEFEQRTGVEILLDLDPDLIIYPENSLILFRILQESLTNIARHSMATRAEIVLSRNGEFVQFMISDNGSGITQDEIKNKKSFGIISMKERAASMGGTFEIKNKNCGGTAIKIILPLNYK